ncbi:MAG TPA: hypothetical protein VEC60_02085 [Reyranella sp.]|nr:hypothetical protein [Reyranella sp.]
MRAMLLASAVVLLTVPALAQTRNQTTAAGSAGVTSRLKSQGYGNVHGLHRTPDGKWVGQATRNGRPVTVTSDPAGITIAR